MPLLLVDDEVTTRNSLRELISSMGYKTILDAKNGLEAQKFILSEKNRLEIIVSDWEMPYMDGIQLLEWVSQNPELNHIPFVLITSDLSKEKLRELGLKFSRLDGNLIKPFQKSALYKVMIEASEHRHARRSDLIYLGTSSAEASAPDYTVTTVSTISQLQEAVHSKLATLGALIIEPAVYQGSETWLSSFKKTAAGSLTLVGCPTKNPADLSSSGDLRAVSQFFANSVAEVCAAMTARRKNSWEVNLLYQQAKSLLQEKKYKLAQKKLEKIIELEPTNVESRTLLSEVLEHQNLLAEALGHLRHAIEQNPFSANAHIKLMTCLAQMPDTTTLKVAAETAVTNCPSPEVFFSAATLMQSKKWTEKVLQLRPNHQGALELLAKLNH